MIRNYQATGPNMSISDFQGQNRKWEHQTVTFSDKKGYHRPIHQDPARTEFLGIMGGDNERTSRYYGKQYGLIHATFQDRHFIDKCQSTGVCWGTKNPDKQINESNSGIR